MNLKSFFAPPVFRGNKEKTLEAITLNTALWTVISLLIIMQIGNYIGGRTPAFISLINYIFLILCFLARYALHRGWLKWASIVMLVMLALGIAHITATILALGTIRTPASTAYILIVLFAGFQFGNKGIIMSIVGIAFILLALTVAESNQLLRKADYSVGITQWISYTALFGLTGNFMFSAIKLTRRSLRQSQQEIKQRKRAEDRLHIFSRIIEQNPASIMIVSPDGIIEDVNPKFSELTGYTKDEVFGANPRILQSGLHTKGFYEDMWSTIYSGQEWRGVLKNRKKSGELFWERASISPVFNEKKEITHFVAVKEDITAQRAARRKQNATNHQLKIQLKEINNLQKILKKQALHDPLTGLHNRRYMDEMLEKEFSRAKRENYPVSIVLLDMDYLKNFNDSGGHATGDHALRTLAAQLKASIRQGDTVCRYGGDEFAIILPKTTSKDALTRAIELQKRMQGLTLLYRAEQTLRISITAGIATYPTHGKTSEEVFNYADVALYRAKLKGRDRVELFEQTS